MKEERIKQSRDELLTPSEAARELKVSVVTVRSWANAGKLRFETTLGGHRRYSLNEIERVKDRAGTHDEQAESTAFKLLIVDDDRQMRDYLSAFALDSYPNILIETASDGFQAGEKIFMFMPDLIMLDILMPGLDGFKICFRIKSDPRLNHIRVIAMTGSHDDSIKHRIISKGAEQCLIKPIDPGALEAILKSGLLLAGVKSKNR